MAYRMKAHPAAHAVVQRMGHRHDSRAQPVGGRPVLIRGHLGVLPTDLMPAYGALTDLHAIPGHFRVRTFGRARCDTRT
jgi:hypothetical protein